MLQLSNLLIENTKQKKQKRRLPSINEDIFSRIANDDKAAFEEFYRATEQTVYAYILSILKNPQDSQDVMQDTYLKIRSAAHLYQPQGKPMAWVFTIARNLCLMKIRSNSRINQSAIEDLENSLDYSTTHKGQVEDRMVLNCALSILSEEERTIVILHAVSGLKHHEIAKNLDLPLSTVLSKYNRALKKLKKTLLEKEP